MKMNNNRILITGAGGFIGKSLTEYLKISHTVFAAKHSDLELLELESIKKYTEINKIHTIIHCASVGGSRKTGYDSGKTDVVGKNLKMFFNMVNNFGMVEKIIHLGTGAEYDLRNYIPKMSEEYFGKHIPIDDYGFSKYVCSKYIEKNDNIINLRLFGIFGKYEDYRFKFITNSIVKNILGMPIVINQNVFFDYLYVNDFVKICEYFIDNTTKHKFYNVTTGQSIDLVSIANIINEISENKTEIIVNNPGLNTEYSGDNTRLLSELPGFTFTPIKTAIKELYRLFQEQLDGIDKDCIIKDEYINYCRVKK